MKYTKHTAENGLRIITVPMPDSQSVTVLVMVEAGSKYETKEENGISHFLEHMCLKGTSKRPESGTISRELDGLGAQFNAFTGGEYTGYYAKAHPKYFEKILDVVSDMYLDPLFEQKEIDKEKGVIIEEINMYEDMPDMQVQHLWDELLYGDQPAGWKILGTKETVSAMNRENFVSYRKKYYVPKSTIVVVAGNIDEGFVREKVSEAFKTMPAGEKNGKQPVKEIQDSPKVLVKNRETDQTHIVMGVRTFGVHHPDVVILRVMNAVLGGSMGSRLFQKLRDEMGVCYYVRSYPNRQTDVGDLRVSTGVDNKRIKEVVSAVLEELQKLVNSPVPEEELQRAKDCLIGKIYLNLEPTDDVASFFADQEIVRGDIRTPEEIAVLIRKVTAADIQRVAKDIFKNEGLNLAIVGRCDESQFKDFGFML